MIYLLLTYITGILTGALAVGLVLVLYVWKSQDAGKLTNLGSRQSELDRFSDWLTDNDPQSHLSYSHKRGAELDERR